MCVCVCVHVCVCVGGGGGGHGWGGGGHVSLSLDHLSCVQRYCSESLCDDRGVYLPCGRFHICQTLAMTLLSTEIDPE